MMEKGNEHIFLLIQAGYSARNFILSGFLKQSRANVTFWSDQDYISQYNLDHQLLKLPPYKANGRISFIQKIKNKAELFYNVKKFRNKNYTSYLVKISKKKSLKTMLKNIVSSLIAKVYATESGIQKLDIPYYKAIRKTAYYQSCKEQLTIHKPNLVFCTHQRAGNAVAPMLAAKDLGIRTVCFIHSWDNIPKGVQLVKADEYFVWSDYMKQELLDHYPFIHSELVKVTGTPQFVTHFDEKYRIEREVFLAQFQLPADKRYILFSGNDRTTSPNDPVYLGDVCKALKEINKEEDKYRILFRPNPIDRNEGFDPILSKHKDMVTELKPDWFGSDAFLWNKGGPGEKDISLLINTILHSDLVVNMGSTMVIDAAILGKPGCYINYDVPSDFNWSVKRTYQFIHFKIIKDIDPILWIHDRKDMVSVLKNGLEYPERTKEDREIWIQRVTKLPIDKTGTRMWNYLIPEDEV